MYMQNLVKLELFRACLSSLHLYQSWAVGWLYKVPPYIIIKQIIWASLWEKRLFAYAKTKTQISCAVTAQLISAFVFAVWIVQFLYYLNLKFQASSHILLLYSTVCVRPGWKPRRLVFSQGGSYFLVFSCTYSENRILLKPVLGGVASVAHFITGHE